MSAWATLSIFLLGQGHRRLLNHCPPHSLLHRVSMHYSAQFVPALASTRTSEEGGTPARPRLTCSSPVSLARFWCLGFWMPAGIIGDWAYNATKLNELAMFFEDAHPFPHVVLDNFFSPEAADRIEHRFPAPNGTWAEWLKQVQSCSSCVSGIRNFSRASLLCVLTFLRHRPSPRAVCLYLVLTR